MAFRTGWASPPVGWCRHAIISRAIVKYRGAACRWVGGAPRIGSRGRRRGWESRRCRCSCRTRLSTGGADIREGQAMGPPGQAPWQGELNPEGADRTSLLRLVSGLSGLSGLSPSLSVCVAGATRPPGPAQLQDCGRTSLSTSCANIRDAKQADADDDVNDDLVRVGVRVKVKVGG